MSSVSKGGETVDSGRVAFAFVDRISSMHTIKEIIAVTRETLSQFGFEWFVMSTMPQDFESVQPDILLLDLPRGWSDHYLANAYHKVDPVVHACRTATSPVDWSDVLPLANAKRQSAEVMDRARDFGMRFGLTLPIHPIDGRICCFSMSASKQPFLNAFTKPAIHLMGVYAFDRVRDITRESKPPERPRLTKREREVLAWSAVGKSASMIGEILSISERTAVAHTLNATQKLGAANKTAAVARALHMRLIHL